MTMDWSWDLPRVSSCHTRQQREQHLSWSSPVNERPVMQTERRFMALACASFSPALRLARQLRATARQICEVQRNPQSSVSVLEENSLDKRVCTWKPRHN